MQLKQVRFAQPVPLGNSHANTYFDVVTHKVQITQEDGFVKITKGADSVHVGWPNIVYVLPAETKPEGKSTK